jgi:hypothetical protein
MGFSVDLDMAAQRKRRCDEQVVLIHKMHLKWSGSFPPQIYVADSQQNLSLSVFVKYGCFHSSYIR